MRKLAALLTTFLLLLGHASVAIQAKNVYQEPDNFINEVFAGVTPDVKRLWIDDELKEKIRKILGHDLSLLRLRYWQHQQRTAWILEEIGKTEPITLGFVINNGSVELTRVLIFRESRGWEIRHPFFTDQYINVTLTPELDLNRHIDGISGATLSVAAFNKLARLALMLHQHSNPMSRE
jgi:FMN-binding domain